MRDGDSAHGNPGEPAGDLNAVDSDTDIGDTNGRGDTLPGDNPERQAELAELRQEVEDEGLYTGREPEGRPAGRVSDRDPPIRNYQRLTVPEIIRQTQRLHLEQLKEVLKFERAHRKRKTLIAELTRIIGEENATA